MNMFSFVSKRLFSLLLAMIALYHLANGQACTGNLVEVKIGNYTYGTSSGNPYIEYDISIKNTGTTTLKLAGYQGGVQYDSGILPGNATLTVIQQPGVNFPGMQNVSPAWQSATRSLRWTNTPFQNEANSDDLPSGVEIVFARFRFTSTGGPWSLSETDFIFTTGTGGTANNIATVYCNGNPNSTGLSQGTSTMTVVNGVNVPLNAPMPVELARFKASAQTTNNLIEWTTESEVNSQFHIVERSADGVNNWKEVGRKNGAGTTAVTREYSLYDENPLSLSYYRLKLLDFNGSYEYSEVVSVQRQTNGGFSVLNMYPMPTDRAVTLQLSLEEDTDLTFTVSDMAGRVLFIREMAGTKGVNNIDLDVADLPPGQYLVEIDNGVVKLPQQLVKQ